MENHGETLNAYNQVKEVSLKRLHIAYFKLHGIGKSKTMRTTKRCGCQEFGGWEVGSEG